MAFDTPNLFSLMSSLTRDPSGGPAEVFNYGGGSLNNQILTNQVALKIGPILELLRTLFPGGGQGGGFGGLFGGGNQGKGFLNMFDLARERAQKGLRDQFTEAGGATSLSGPFTTASTNLERGLGQTEQSAIADFWSRMQAPQYGFLASLLR